VCLDEAEDCLEEVLGSIALSVKGTLLDGFVSPQAIRPKICCTKDRCANMSPLDTVRTCPLASIAIAGPVAKFFHARFASELRSAEPAEYQPWIAF